MTDFTKPEYMPNMTDDWCYECDMVLYLSHDGGELVSWMVPNTYRVIKDDCK